MAENGVKKDMEVEGEFGPNVHVSAHPVILHKVSILRSSSTLSGAFRAVLKEVTYHLGYEATAMLTTRPIDISVPARGKVDHIDCIGQKLVEKIAMIPIMRSGLGMIDSMLELLPNAHIHHIGMYRVKGQSPVQYFNRLPRKCDSDVAYILDPVIETGETILPVIAILKKWGVSKIGVISVIASQKGLKNLADNHPDVHITVAVVDKELSAEGRVTPGLGDAGDRQFFTPYIDDDEALLHPSKRKRSIDQASP